MDMGAEQPDHSGLQAVNHDYAPEVVPESIIRGPLDRTSSLRSPEVYLVEQNEKRSVQVNGYFDLDTNQHPGAPPPEYLESHGQPTDDTYSKKDRIYGLKWKTFWIVLAVIFIVVIAAVVGGAVGGTLPSKEKSDSNSPNNSSPPIQTKQNSGISLMIPADTSGTSTFYTYYQADNGTVMEREYANVSLRAAVGYSMVSTAAKDGSPIAATSWVNSGATFRQIFFIDNNGRVLTSNTTGTQAWSEPYNILTGDSAHPNSVALAVCTDTKSTGQGLDGLRVYYGSASGGVQEVGMDFSESTTPIWHMWFAWHTADALSGADCTLVDNKNHLYLRNSTTEMIQQWTWDYVNVSDWQIGVSGASNMSSGSDIAVTNDSSGNDYIFYQTADGSLERSLYYGHNTVLTDAVDLTPKPLTGSKLAAAYIPSSPTSGSSDSGAAIAFQPQDNATNIYYDIVSRDGGQSSSGSQVGGYIS